MVKYIFPHEISPNMILWRYLTLPKFISLLQTRKLFFSRADYLQKSDPYEGKINPLIGMVNEHKIFDRLYRQKGIHESNLLNKKVEEIMEFKRLFFNVNTFINCWRIDENDTLYMWKDYSNIEDGIAIQTTYKRICNALKKNAECIYAGMITYCDMEKDKNRLALSTELPVLKSEMLELFMKKQFAYKTEQEFRFLYIEDNESTYWNELENLFESKPKYQIGFESKKCYKAEVDLNELITNIYIAPNAEEWYVELIKDIISKYDNYNEGIADKVSKSNIKLNQG